MQYLFWEQFLKPPFLVTFLLVLLAFVPLLTSIGKTYLAKKVSSQESGEVCLGNLPAG